MKTIVQILEGARALIEDEAHWTPVAPRYLVDENCIVTALVSVGGWPSAKKPLEAHTRGESLIHFNKHHSHEEVLALFDRTIEAAKS
jgi:hypothetical protein